MRLILPVATLASSLYTLLMVNELIAAAAKYDNNEPMTSRELEEARAYFQEKRNSRKVKAINERLRRELLERLAK